MAKEAAEARAVSAGERVRGIAAKASESETFTVAGAGVTRSVTTQVNRDRVRRRPLMVSAREARATFADLIRNASEHDVTILRNSKPVAVLVSHERYEDLIDQIEELQDLLSIAAREHDTVSLAEAAAELGLDD